MKIYRFLCLALVIFIELQSLYSSALGVPWKHEFPFKLPFASRDIIHRAIPIQVKYTKEVRQPENAFIRREWPLSDPATNNANKDDNKKPEETEPKNDITIKLAEIMDKKDLYDEILSKKSNAYRPYRLGAVVKALYLTSTDAPRLDNTQPALDSNPDKDDSEEDDSKDDDSEEDDEDADRGSRGPQEKIEESIETEIPKFPYRLIIQLMNPKGQMFRKMRTGYVSELQAQLFKKGIFYFLRSLREKKVRKEEIKDSEDLKKNEKQDEISHLQHISAPVLRYSSQVRDKKGNLYRQEKILQSPASLEKILAKIYKDDDKKSIRYAKEIKKTEPSEKDDEESKEKSITGNGKYSGNKSADDAENAINEAIPVMKSYRQEKHQKKEIIKPLRVVDSNSKFDDVAPQSESKLKSSVTKGDDGGEKEKLQKIVIIRPVPRVFQASLDVNPYEQSEDAPKMMEPTVMSDESKKLPFKQETATKYMIIPEETNFFLRRILDPLRRLFNVKILARPGAVEGE